MKLRTKIQLFSSIFMLILIILINTSIYYLFYKLSVDSELEQLETHTESIVGALNKEPDIPEKELLSAYLPGDGMIRVFKEDGSLAIDTLTKHDTYTELPGEFSSSSIEVIISQKTGPDIAVVAQPIIWNDGTIVTMQVSQHLTDLHETMKTLFYVVIVASIIMLIPTIIAGRVLSSFLLKPIHALIQTMRENKTRENWKKIDLQGRSKDELYQMEATFNDMIDHLKDNFQKQEQFVSDASHELKTPISIVKSYAQLLARRGEDRPELFREAVGAIDSEADRMQKLVEQMLLLAKNKNDESYTTVNIVTLCKNIIMNFTGAYERTIRLKQEHDTILIKVNKEQFKQVIYILIDNALKYSEDEVNVSISQHKHEVIVEVRDFGQGIPEDEQLKVFDRFYRVDKARNRDTGGTGLGLSIAKKIVIAHEGTISASSIVGKGSVFTVKLPIVKES